MIVVRFHPAGLTKAQYDATVERINAELGEATPDGALVHVCFGTDGDLHVSEIWESREKWQAFGEKLMPILAAAGVDPGQPDVFDVHNSFGLEEANA
jgi:hypothetical protein